MAAVELYFAQRGKALRADPVGVHHGKQNQNLIEVEAAPKSYNLCCGPLIVQNEWFLVLDDTVRFSPPHMNNFICLGSNFTVLLCGPTQCW